MKYSQIDKEIGKMMAYLAESIEDELEKSRQEDLEKYWFFKWDNSAPLDVNLYEFHNSLGLYGRHCRRWEEKHNGHMFVVERVRDKYLLPKIREFLKTLFEGIK